MTDRDLLQWPCARLLDQHPYARDFFSACGNPAMDRQQTVGDFLAGLTPDRLDALGMDRTTVVEQFLAFVNQMQRLQSDRDTAIRNVTVVGGHDKDGRLEDLQVTLSAGEMIAVVGPTGAGKSLLLADIESLAQGDTPSGRRILINDRPPDEAQRLSGEHRLVAQLSQNMNFVMDLSAHEFLSLHAESRLVDNVAGVVDQILQTAVALAGEPFDAKTPVTALSGGQSRALMIADVACLSASPIVLIDEIENAGVDRRQALGLLVKKEKIVLMATHDPLLALSGSRRLVIRNGGIDAVLDTSDEERVLLQQLDTMDARLTTLRNRIRQGKRLSVSH
ncbi:ABC transporter ATP-binding protein [Desulfosarcina ovata subsp. sediminis]|uniref:ABC transporter ATP-binding protein n=1 Tax=Desulfosarcina ovata subsp. sediminis TaxID=885957 RepID=A0A5K8A2G1_9BACT|nr:ATP-binding cassette domain-containing protein [Desulfosarcina ovata]BBO86460.1 ABC transporter ATP-binding protein [Desulfosarcina ovata subsp. sediminis]